MKFIENYFFLKNEEETELDYEPEFVIGETLIISKLEFKNKLLFITNKVVNSMNDNRSRVDDK